MSCDCKPDIMRFFTYAHLPDHLKIVSKVFADAANEVLERTYPGAEQSTALRKLLEAKDAAVRAALHPPVKGADHE